MVRRLLFVVPVILLLLSLWGCSEGPVVEQTDVTATARPTPLPTPDYTPEFEAGACPFDYPQEMTIRCGYLIVPEERAAPERTIRLPVAIIPSHGDAPAPDPVVFLNGGPGVDTLKPAVWLIEKFGPLLEDRDLILFDQRGAGFAEPSLNCPELEEAELEHIEESLDDEEALLVTTAATSACRERLLAAGVNLSAYHSAASAADLDDLRQVLGYETWNLLGISYGTRLALTAVRDYGHSGTIRSVILDSVYPPQVDGYVSLAASAHRDFELLFTRCEALEMCAEAYPDLGSRFYRLVDELNAEALTITVTDRVNHTFLRVPLDGDDLVHTLFAMMYDDRRIINLPKMLDQLESGRSPILNEYASDMLYRSAYQSEGMHLSVQCAEEAPFASMEALEAQRQSLPPQLGALFARYLADRLAVCELWQVRPAGAVENEPVSSDIPTLLLAGDYDPITPPAFALETAHFLDNSYYYEFEGIGHAVLTSSGCGVEITAAFLEQPDTAPAASCLDRLYFGFVTR